LLGVEGRPIGARRGTPRPDRVEKGPLHSGLAAETGEPERARWITNLDAVAALEPALVVASHKKVDNDNDPKIIAQSQQYLRDFTRIAAEETTTAGIVARMTDSYPDWENLRTLWHSARTAITRKSG